MATEAAIATLDHVWSVLEPLGHPLAMMGRISLAAWNYIRATVRSMASIATFDTSRSIFGCKQVTLFGLLFML